MVQLSPTSHVISTNLYFSTAPKDGIEDNLYDLIYYKVAFLQMFI